MKVLSRRKSSDKLIPLRDPDALSTSAKYVMAAYRKLPESHRPSYDLEAIVRALDLKYGSLAESHLDLAYVDDGYDYSYLNTSYACLTACTCSTSYEDDTYGDKIGECRAPEYLELYEAMGEIREALQDRERALQLAERRAELDGVASDLQNVEALTSALRSERDAIRGVTDELTLNCTLPGAAF